VTKLRTIIAASAALLTAAASTSAQAFSLLTGWSGGPIWADAWTSSQNTTATTPLRWVSSDAVDDVWFRVYFNGRNDESANNLKGLAASLTFTLTDVTNGGKDWTFGYELLNASNNQFLNNVQNIVTASNVRSFSFDVFHTDDNSATRLTGASLVGPIGLNEYDGLGQNLAMNAMAQNFLNSSTQDICIKSANLNTCHGGGSTGPGNGQSYSGAFQLHFNAAPAFVAFTDPMVRFNAIQKNGYGDYSGIGIPYAWVPEPATWAMMILGFGAVGSMVRTQRRRKLVPLA
jgi:hypothetical protein